jgi:hypothetical protein
MSRNEVSNIKLTFRGEVASEHQEGKNNQPFSSAQATGLTS